jgi:predicted GH43/DUF377 family glycosyl hydrolase
MRRNDSRNSMFTRSKFNPILLPDERHSWEEAKVYNSAALYEDGIYHLFYRAMGKKWISSIGYATSTDGEHFTRSEYPLIEPEHESEKQGIEDPRIVKIDNMYFLTYTAYDGVTARLCLATSKDLKKWHKHGRMFEQWDYTKGMNIWEYLREIIKEKLFIKKEWAKAGGIFPETMQKKYWMLFGDNKIRLAHSRDGIKWTPLQEPFLSARCGEYFDNNFVEMGPPPIKTDKGWLILYHGINKRIIYSIGFLILDSDDITKILYRSDKPIFEPTESYELSGIVDILPGGYKKMQRMSKHELDTFITKMDHKGKMPRVTFSNGAVSTGNTLRIYYGASDSVLCTATASLDEILSSL